MYVGYYNIEKRNNIASVDPQFILNHESLFPGAVVRNAGGAVQAINDTFQNIGRLETEGFDFGFTYTTKEFVWGKVDIEFNGNYIQRYVIQNLPDQPFIVRAGRYTLPVYKHSAQIFYSKTLFGMDTLSTGVTWNYIDSEQDQTPEPSGKIHVIGNWNTFDYQIATALERQKNSYRRLLGRVMRKMGKNHLARKLFLPIETREIPVGGDT